MSSRIGADIGQLDSLASKFSTDSSQLASMISSITGQLGATWWEGPARQRFEANWQSILPSLNNLVTSLQECSQEATSRARAIESAGS